MTKAEIRAQIVASIAVKQAVLGDEDLISQIETLAANCVQCLRSGGKIIFAGNGCSFADAQHLSAEFISRFMFDRAPLASIVLGANNSAISAIGNDYGYEQVFARELMGISKKGDVFIPISTSGNSARKHRKRKSINRTIGAILSALSSTWADEMRSTPVGRRTAPWQYENVHENVPISPLSQRK